jgi:gas vesicle protein
VSGEGELRQVIDIPGLADVLTLLAEIKEQIVTTGDDLAGRIDSAVTTLSNVMSEEAQTISEAIRDLQAANAPSPIVAQIQASVTRLENAAAAAKSAADQSAADLAAEEAAEQPPPPPPAGT